MRILIACLALFCAGCSSEAARQRHYERGERYLAAGQHAEAIIEFRNAVNRDEQWGEARFKLAEAYAANAEPELAYKEYLRAADLLPDSLDAQLKAAAYLLLAGLHEDAKARAERVLARHPDNVDAQIALGNALAGLRSLDAATTQITGAIALDPGRSQSYIALARVRLAQGRQDEARAAFDKAVGADATSVAAHLARANFQWSTGDLAAAESSLKKVLELDAADVLARRTLATLYLASNRAAEAEEHLKFVAETTATEAARLSLADYYIAARRHDEARQVLLGMTAVEGSRSAAETRLASIFAAEGLKTEGERLLDAVLERDPTHATAHLLKARWLLDAMAPEPALEHARQALAANPELIPALYLKAQAEARTRRTADAIKTLHEILRLNPADDGAHIQLSALHLIRNEIDSAVHQAEEALGNAPQSVDAHLALARALIARGDPQAAAALASARARAPDTASVHVVEGALRLRRGDRAAARIAFERALRLDARSREALMGLTTIDVLDRNTRGAKARVEPQMKAFGSDPEFLLLAGKTLLAAGDVTQAEDALRRAVALDPLGIEAVALLANVLTRRGALEASRAVFDDEAARDSRNLSARIMAAVIVHTQGKVADAKTRYQAILSMEPRAAIAANNLASIYTDEGESLDQAQRLAQSAAELQPSHPGIQDTLGLVYLKRQLIGPAIVQFQKSVAAEPANALYHYHLGLALSKSGETARARQSLQRAMTLAPRFDPAQRAFETLDDR